MMYFYRYEEQVREQQNQLEKEDFSDMVAEHAAKQKVNNLVNRFLLFQLYICNTDHATLNYLS